MGAKERGSAMLPACVTHAGLSTIIDDPDTVLNYFECGPTRFNLTTPDARGDCTNEGSRTTASAILTVILD